MASLETLPTTDAAPASKLLLVGHPNVGKSVLFNCLSGSRVTVSNYPGTTVDLERTLVRLPGGWRELIDTPGARSLVAASDDERVTQSCLLDNPGVPVAQVGDAKNLRRTLFLSSQLIELEHPLVLVLNLVDECRELDLEPCQGELAAALGVPVCPTAAVRDEGIQALVESLDSARLGRLRIEYPKPIEDAVLAISLALSEGPEPLPCGQRGLALLFLAGDAGVEERLASSPPPAGFEALLAARRTAAGAIDGPLSLAIHQARYDQVSRLAERMLAPRAGARRLRRAVARAGYYTIGLPLLGALTGAVLAHLAAFALAGLVSIWTEAAGSTLRIAGALAGMLGFAWRGRGHRRRGLTAKESLGELAIFPSTALPLLVLTLYAAYLVVGVFAAGTCVDFIENKIFASVEGGPGFDVGLFVPLSENFSPDGEPLGWWFFYVPWQGINHHLAALTAAVVPPGSLVHELLFGPPPGSGRSDMGLVTVGLTYSIAIILPIVVFFFLIFGLLEDSGFLPRIAALTDRTLKRIGLNGRAVLPLILGLGCDTMATMTTRILGSRKERLIAILLLALAVPCSAQIGIIAGVMAKVSPFSLVLFVAIILGQLLLVGAVASRVIGGRASDFLIEIPPVRVPQFRNVVQKTRARVKWFLIEAVPLFILGTFILFVVEKLGVIPFLVGLGEPLVTGLLGLPEQATLGFLLGFLRRDFGAVHILSNFTAAEGAASATEVRQVLIAVVVITLFVPCLANYFMMVREQGAKVATLMTAFIIPYAILVGAALRWTLERVPGDWLVRGQ